MLASFGTDIEKIEETVYKREEFPADEAKDFLGTKKIAIGGYGRQGRAHALNLKKQGFNVIVGQRPGSTWDKAVREGWEPKKNLFTLSEAAQEADIVSMLMKDGDQTKAWEEVKDHVDGKTLCYAHGFPIHFNNLTKIVPSKNTNVLLIAPKGAGDSVLENFLKGTGINVSVAVYQEPSIDGLKTALAYARGIGAGFAFPTTFMEEVVSDHLGERAVLLGGLWALAESAYDALKSEVSEEVAFIRSSEQLTQVLLPLIGRSGAKEIYAQARLAGQTDTVLKYQTAVREKTMPLMEELYQSCASGTEAQIALDVCGRSGATEELKTKLKKMDNTEMWLAGKRVREREGNRNYKSQINNWALAGAVLGLMESQYQTLSNHKHSVSECCNETIEETTESLNQFYQKNGMAYLLGVCSETAQVGADIWGPRFKERISPVFHRLGTNYGGTQIIDPHYTVTTPNMWHGMDQIRKLRPQLMV